MIDWLSILVGLFIGLAVMWLVDYIFYGQRSRADAAELRSLREQLKTNTADYEESQARVESVESQLVTMGDELVTARADSKEAAVRIEALETELKTTKSNLAAAKIEVDDLRAQLRVANIRAGEAVAPTKNNRKDDLKLINGIGPAYEKRLNEAGITTFADLSHYVPERVHEIISPQTWQQIDPEAWVTEAKLFVQTPHLQDDELVKIKGIGPKYAQLLRRAGVSSLTVLALKSAEQVKQLLGDELVAGADPADWIAQAQKLVG
ncbi:MAG: DUF4332 domain-containing protein [Anaerolineales bacterium]|nr:DUF4332 domain-containing protein [Anaerolineales bacterium]